MSYRPRLLDADIQKIRSLHRSGETLGTLAARYERPRHTIRDIVAGRSYRWVTAIVTEGAAVCPRCETWERALRNQKRTREVRVEIECVDCEEAMFVTVEKSMAREGVIRCGTCSRRRQ